MTDVNHRRKNKLPVNQRQGDRRNYHNGYAIVDNKKYREKMQEFRKELDEQGKQDVRILGEGTGAPRIGSTDYLDKSMHGWGRKCDLADKSIGAGIGNDFANGHRGMAKAVKGAKKFVRSRVRFHENASTKKLVHEE